MFGMSPLLPVLSKDAIPNQAIPRFTAVAKIPLSSSLLFLLFESVVLSGEVFLEVLRERRGEEVIGWKGGVVSG